MKKYFNSFASFLKKNGVIENKNNLIMKFKKNQNTKTLFLILYQSLIIQEPISKKFL
jgi:hypothetical protein